MPGFDFGDPPETVAKNVGAMRSIRAQRQSGNSAVKLKHDTERYLVLVFPDRESREAAALAIGLPQDERYVYGPAIELRLRQDMVASDAQIEAERPCLAADNGHSGAGG